VGKERLKKGTSPSEIRSSLKNRYFPLKHEKREAVKKPRTPENQPANPTGASKMYQNHIQSNWTALLGPIRPLDCNINHKLTKLGINYLSDNSSKIFRSCNGIVCGNERTMTKRK
jgi:hypothetical protein